MTNGHVANTFGITRSGIKPIQKEYGIPYTIDGFKLSDNLKMIGTDQYKIIGYSGFIVEYM